MIELQNVEKTYSNGAVATPVLRDISLRIAEQEYVAIMGPSGSGKSTLLNILGCLDRPSAGRYVLAGRDVTTLGDRELSATRNEHIGFVFQLFHLLPSISALENVLLPLLYRDEQPPDARRRAIDLLTRLGLGDRIHYLPTQLSGGQQQRVAIARALITEPTLLLADEPTGNLDDVAGQEILSILDDLHRGGRTIVVVTHSTDVARRASRVVRLGGGTIVGDERSGV